MLFTSQKTNKQKNNKQTKNNALTYIGHVNIIYKVVSLAVVATLCRSEKCMALAA